VHDFIASDGKDRLDLGLKSLRVAEQHFAMSGGCLPAPIEFGGHHPAVQDAPKFHQTIFTVSENEDDPGILFFYRIAIGDDWNCNS